MLIIHSPQNEIERIERGMGDASLLMRTARASCGIGGTMMSMVTATMRGSVCLRGRAVTVHIFVTLERD